MQDYIDEYMAGSLRQLSIQRATAEAVLRARSSGSLGTSSEGGEENDDDGEADSVERETDMDDFRRWLEEQPRGSGDAAPVAFMAAASSLPSPAEATSHAPSRAAALEPAREPAREPTREPSRAEATSQEPSQAEATSHAPSMPTPVLLVEPSSQVPTRAEASSGSVSNGKPSSEAELSGDTEPPLKRSKVMATGGSSKDGEAIWHAPGNCEKCLKPPDMCNLLAMICIRHELPVGCCGMKWYLMV